MRRKADPDRVMTVSLPTRRGGVSRRRRIACHGARLASEPSDVHDGAARPVQPLELETISNQWQIALDAAERALFAADSSLAPDDLLARRYAVLQERHQIAEELERLAREAGVRPTPWLSPVPVTNRMLGLPPASKACLFDVEGVLTDSGLLHAQAWGEVFDDFLLRLTETTGWHFIPFDRVADYRAYLDGRSRLEGVHAFLSSRGIRVPEGRADDAELADTAWGLANKKGEALARGLRLRGVSALPGTLRYLQAAGRAGLKRAVVSASGNTLPMLELAGLATLVEERVDAAAIRSEGLRSRPAPDLLLAACAHLGVDPEEAVTLTHSPAGVVAGEAAGLAVIGVGDGAHGELLRAFAAKRVVPSLSVLLDARLAESAKA
jgi:beta-phosphoglucomutase-like phosphatase (HAD superfamily)